MKKWATVLVFLCASCGGVAAAPDNEALSLECAAIDGPTESTCCSPVTYPYKVPTLCGAGVFVVHCDPYVATPAGCIAPIWNPMQTSGAVWCCQSATSE